MNEGVIAEVMETWPLQLVLSGSHGKQEVMLSETPVVRRADGSPGDVALLRPGQYVQVEGDVVTVLDRG